jgi:hypothetical protein
MIAVCRLVQLAQQGNQKCIFTTLLPLRHHWDLGWPFHPVSKVKQLEHALEKSLDVFLQNTKYKIPGFPNARTK